MLYKNNFNQFYSFKFNINKCLYLVINIININNLIDYEDI